MGEKTAGVVLASDHLNIRQENRSIYVRLQDMTDLRLFWHGIVPGIWSSVRTTRGRQGTWGVRRGDRSHLAWNDLEIKSESIVVL
jgi:hypothetical protein